MNKISKQCIPLLLAALAIVMPDIASAGGPDVPVAKPRDVGIPPAPPHLAHRQINVHTVLVRKLKHRKHHHKKHRHRHHRHHHRKHHKPATKPTGAAAPALQKTPAAPKATPLSASHS